MAKTKGGLFSLDASGSLAKTLTFSKWKGRKYVRQLVKPRNPRSALQTGMRAAFRFTSQVYKTIGATPQANWKVAAKVGNITALDAMQRVNQKATRQNKGVVKDPTLAAGAVEAAPTAPAAAAGFKSLNLTWVDSVGANDFGTYVYMSTQTGFTPDVSNLQFIIAHGTQKVTVPRLVSGTTYFFVLKGVENGGTLGTATAQFSGIPT
jgi:hypothetical protein